MYCFLGRATTGWKGAYNLIWCRFVYWMFIWLTLDTWIAAALLSRKGAEHSKAVWGLSKSHHESRKIYTILCAILGQLFVSVWNRAGGATISIPSELLFTTILQKEKLDVPTKQHIQTGNSDWFVSYQTDILRRQGWNTAFRRQQLLFPKRKSADYQLEHTTCKQYAQCKHQRRDQGKPPSSNV